MKLYAVPISPFSGRVRLALAYKGLKYEDMSLPPGGTRDANFLSINPIGKIPTLIVDDGSVIAESETIIAYLDEVYPEPPLLPDEPAARARVRTIIRVAENYATPSLFRLFPQFDPAARDLVVVTAESARLRDGLALLDRFVDDERYAALGQPTMADCILFPTMLLYQLVFTTLDLGEAFPAGSHLSNYFAKAQLDPLMSAEKRMFEDACAAS
jgi:glutathione S-transferase